MAKRTVCLMVTPAQFATVSLIDARPVALALSLTVTVAVRAPLSAAVVGHASETGPLLVVGVLVMVLPSTLSV